MREHGEFVDDTAGWRGRYEASRRRIQRYVWGAVGCMLLSAAAFAAMLGTTAGKDGHALGAVTRATVVLGAVCVLLVLTVVWCFAQTVRTPPELR